MPITNSEQGAITEAEFVKLVMLTSDGNAVPTRPVVDDEHRDFDIHLRRHLAALAVQLKTTLRLRKHGRQRLLQITFRLRPPLFTSRRFWYFLAHFDVQTRTFTEPMYLVPSTYLHRHARRGTSMRNGAIPFQIKASLGPDAHDKWSRFRVTSAELGPRIVSILKELGERAGFAAPAQLEGASVILINKRRETRPGTTARRGLTAFRPYHF